MCGRLQCNGGDITVGYMGTNNLFYTSQYSFSGYLVNEVIYDVGLENQDPGLVPNGASCGALLVGLTAVRLACIVGQDSSS